MLIMNHIGANPEEHMFSHFKFLDMKNITTRINLYLILMLALYSNVSAKERDNHLIVSGVLTHFPCSGEKVNVPGFYQYPIDSGSIYLKKDFPKQESRCSLIFSGMFIHPEGKQNYLVARDASGIMGYYSYPMSPGLGVLYQYQIFKENYLLVGINYQVCHVASTEYGILRFRFREPSVSVQLKHYFLKNKRIGLFSTIGLSGGQLKSLVVESHGHINYWGDFGTTYLEKYSNDDSFIDVVFNTGIFIPSSHIEIAPAIGCRVKDNWMSYYRHRFFYGLLINYQLKFHL